MRKNPLFCFCLLALMLLPATSMGAELGRRDLSAKQGATNITEAGGIPVEENYNTPSFPGVGLEFGLNWSEVSWDQGRQSYDDNVWSPQLSLFYGVHDSLDIRATFKYMDMKDTSNGIECDLSTTRLGVGAKGWLNSIGWPVVPFLGANFNYYIISSDESGNEEGMFGLNLEAGLAYPITDNTFIQACIHGETSFHDGKVGGEDLSINAFGVLLGFGMIL